MTTNTEVKISTKRPRKMARERASEAARQVAIQGEPKTRDDCAKRSNKTTLVLELLRRTEGATIDQLTAATGWLPHTTRAALTGLKKKGHAVSSKKGEGRARVYRVAAAE
jgi:hypothetical protein